MQDSTDRPTGQTGHQAALPPDMPPSQTSRPKFSDTNDLSAALSYLAGVAAQEDTSRAASLPVVGRLFRPLIRLRNIGQFWRKSGELMQSLVRLHQELTQRLDALEASSGLPQQPPGHDVRRAELAGGLADSAGIMRAQAASLKDLTAAQAQALTRLANASYRQRPALRLLVDASTYQISNNGDIAMFQMLVRRVWARFPDAHIRIVTNDPNGLWEKVDARIQPVLAGDRAQAGDPLAQWMHAVENCDAVMLTGGGYFTDAFADHATYLLHTLQAAQQRGLPTFIVGCGFEPVTHEALSRLAHQVLPAVTLITCREARTSPGVLRSFGVDDAKVIVTGDDAIERAYEHRADALGSGLGINLRNHSYNAVGEAQFAAVRDVVRTFLNRHNAPLVPAPISNYRPGDADAIRELLRGIDDTSDGGITLDTPETLIPRIATCRVMLTGSYHSAVFALATGIPAVCLTRSSHYEHKMTGLLDMFDANPGERVIALDDPQLVAKLSAALAAAWEHAPAEQDALLEKARAQIALGTAAYARIFDRIAPPG